jgi:hypothetical protein
MADIRVVTDKPVALDSPDHLHPWGTARDNSVNLAFNRRLSWWIPASMLRVLDLGCAGGEFVKSILDLGGISIGIEGSDYSKIQNRAEWGSIPHNLLNADLTEPFKIFMSDHDGRYHRMRFNVVTAWEVMEHIREEKLKVVFENISRHLEFCGVVLLSISPNEEVIEDIRFHQTVEDRQWWISKLSRFGYVHHDHVLPYFAGHWVRGEPNDAGLFHLILTRRGEHVPFQNRLKLLTFVVKIHDGLKRTMHACVPSCIKHVHRQLRHWHISK